MPSIVRPRRTIAVVAAIDGEYSRQLVLGAAKYAVSHGMSICHVQRVDVDTATKLKADRVAGLVGVFDDASARDLVRKSKLPAVSVSHRNHIPGMPSVDADHEAIGRLAAKHLLGRGFRNLAFCGEEGPWSTRARAAGFTSAARTVRTNLVELTLRDGEWTDAHRSSLARQLRKATTPLAVMCMSDVLARHLLDACELANLRVPHAVGIVGVDNDPIVCRGVAPTLTSIDANASRVGYDAVAVLQRLLDGRLVADRTLVAPLGLVPRESTNITPGDDVRLGRALDFIHAHADAPIGVADVAKRVGVGRRTLERHFRAALRRSVAEVVRDVQVERAKQLLIDTDLTLEQIARSSGLGYLRQLRIAFAKVAGMTPGRFRKQFRGG